MKFLCLHGMGTNSAILKIQLRPVLKQLELKDHEFVFIDGTMECAPPKDIAALFPGPYLSYYDAPTQALLNQAFRLIHTTIRAKGPFDGVIGFSQGAALASAIMLEHAALHPYDEGPFGMAIFFGASAPFDRLGRSHTGNLPEAWEFNKVALAKLNGAPLLRRYDAEASRENGPRIRVPTVHVIGDVDPYRAQAEDLLALCAGVEGESQFLVRHPEGHRIPWLASKVGEIVKRVEECVEAASWAY